MDVLTDVVESVRLSSAVHGRWEFSAPWGLVFAGWPAHACFYVITRGTALIEVDGADSPLHVAGGEFVLLAKGQRHVIKDSAATVPQSAATVLGRCANRRTCQPGGVFEHGGGGARATLISGCFGFDAPDNPLIAALPPVIHVASDEGPPQRWLESSLQFISDEMASGQLGAETVVGRLADILLVQAVRAHLARGGGAVRGWLRALLDPQISQALALMHEHPAEPWSVETLASRVAMSRSAFAARFSSLVGEPPLTYLTRWRMHRAARLLTTSLLRVHEIAEQVGYDTESAFHKAFKRSLGVAPSVYRRTTMNGAGPAMEPS
ncbi:MAG TPA: AraC family transcriptional regulator [Myxococcaceae bacterium]|nr:AraC family transcriptional regulator [Myxococcaceae bacterium]